MKKLKVLFSIFLFATLITSCESDDPLASVKYQIVGFDNSISQIKYNVIGGTIDVTDRNDFGNGSDSRKLSINILPFTARLQVTAGNATTVNKTYQLKIFVDGNQKGNYDLIVPAESSATGSIEYVVNTN